MNEAIFYSQHRPNYKERVQDLEDENETLKSMVRALELQCGLLTEKIQQYEPEFVFHFDGIPDDLDEFEEDFE